jgi:glycosyltransferase involved in cell wall biosynthesis
LNSSLLWVHDLPISKTMGKIKWLEMTKELCNLGWQVTLVAGDSPRDEVDRRVRVICLPRPRVFLVGYLLFHATLLLLLISRGPKQDVILFPQKSAPFLLPIVPVRNVFGWRRPKLVMDVRTEVMVTGSVRAKLWIVLFSIAHRMSNWLADGQTAITQRMAKAVGIPDEKLLGIWPSGARVEWLAPAISMRQWPTLEGPLCLVYIGVLSEERNLLELCEAVQSVREEGLNVKLKIAGEGPQRGELEDFAGKVGEDVIEVFPAVPQQDVPSVLAAGHVGALPFPDRACFRGSSPIKMFEYMAAGLPILATRIVCHTDVLQDEYTFWAEQGSPSALAEAIRGAWARRKELATMGHSAALAAREHTWERSAKKLSEALERILDR